MGNWSLYGILLIIGFGVALFSFLLSHISVANPLTGQPTSVLGLVWSWISPF